MPRWKAILSSGSARATATAKATSKSEAKNSVFNQFLKLEPSSIEWDGQPTFWVVMHDIFRLEESDSDEA